QRANERFVEGIVAGALEDASNQIKDQGLDPYELSASVYQRLAVTDLVVVKAAVEDFVLTGLSNIVLNRFSYNILLSRATFEVSLPNINADVKSADVDITVLGIKIFGDLSGSLSINDVKVTGTARVSIGISGVSIRSVDVDLSLGGVNSNLAVSVFGNDISEKVNTVAGTAIPAVIEENRSDINEALNHY
ncbi:JHBP domain-containing protein, partial [Streptococcus pneumoniae]